MLALMAASRLAGLRFSTLTSFDVNNNKCAGTLRLEDGTEKAFAGPLPPSASPVVTYCVLAAERREKLHVTTWLDEPCEVDETFLSSPAAYFAARLSAEQKKLLLALLKPRCPKLTATGVAQYGAHTPLQVLDTVRGADKELFPQSRGVFDLVTCAADPAAWDLYLRAYSLLGRAATAHLAAPDTLRLINDNFTEALFPTASSPVALQDVSFAWSPDEAKAALAPVQRAWKDLRRAAAFGNHITAASVRAEYGDGVLEALHEYEVFLTLVRVSTAYERRLSPAPRPYSLEGVTVHERWELCNLEPSTYRDTVGSTFITWCAAKPGVCRPCAPRARCYAVHEDAGLVYVTDLVDADTVATKAHGNLSRGGLTFVSQVPVDLAHAVFEPASLASVGLYALSAHAPELSWTPAALARALSFLAPGGKLCVWGPFDGLKAML